MHNLPTLKPLMVLCQGVHFVPDRDPGALKTSPKWRIQSLQGLKKTAIKTIDVI